jgi:hypothetical protein
VRPNLGSLVDWDGDGRQDLVACEFEHSIRLYRNRADSSPGEEPVFDDPEGSYLIKPSSIMMISGADVIDFNADGDLDVLTGQGHGGSGIRFFERDFIDDQLNGTQPVVQVRSAENQSSSLLEIVRRYADAMLQHGRDVYGRQHSQLFLSALDRRQLQPLSIRPAPPGGIRRGDRAGLPWQKLVGANPHNDENLLRLMYSLSAVTNDPQYANAADHQIQWFFQHAQSPVTGLMAWGEHMSWDVMLDRPIASGDELVHEFARPWLLWDRTFAVAPDAAKRFAIGLWEHQIADHQTGAFDRHAPFDRHGPRDGRDFPRHAGFYIHTWAHAYQHTQDPVFLRAIEIVLARFERKRTDGGGVAHSTIGPLDVWTAAQLVPDPLATRLKEFADQEDELVLGEIQQRYRQPDGSLRFQANWQAGYAAGATIDLAMFALARWQQTQAHEYRQLVLALADAYVDALPDEDVDVWPMTLSHVITAQAAAYRMSNDLVYLQQACRFATLAVDLYWQDSPLPRASLKTDHYETITGGDSLALSLLEVHAVRNGLSVQVPANTIDR